MVTRTWERKTRYRNEQRRGPGVLACTGAVQIHRSQTWRTSNRRPICNRPRSYFNPAKLACRNSRPDAVNNATKTPCPMAIFRAR